jgi:quercetin dioxygenase-like cupin family protein
MTRLIEDPVLRQRYSFERRDDVLIVDMWVDPGGGVTPHVHPAMEERFRVLEGRAEFLAGRTWTEAPEAVVPPGTRHAYRNRSSEPAHIVCEARPPSTLQEFLEAVAGLSRAGAITRAGLPRTPKAALQAAVVAHHHRDMVRLGFPLPPPPVLAALATLGERLGYRADAFRSL